MTLLDLVMTAGGLPVESFEYRAERGEGARLDVTVVGDARGLPVEPVQVVAGDRGATFTAAFTLTEWEAERGGKDWTTTLHASGTLIPERPPLPELVPWEDVGDADAMLAQERARQIADLPVAHRAAAARDGRRMPVDGVVQAVLATVPHRVLVAAPFPGYDLRADGGPTYSTAGRTAQDVVRDLWGVLGITAEWEDGLLTIRPPGPTGDLILDAPVESERIERITLDAPNLELEGGRGSGNNGGNNGRGDDEDGRGRKDLDPSDPDHPDNSPDPDERDGGGSGGFSSGKSPTPQPGQLSPNAVPFTWAAVPNASQYILERVEGFPDSYTLWSRIAISNGTRYTDNTVRVLTTYTYRLLVNATALSGVEGRNVIYQPSDTVQVTTPPWEVTAPPHPPTDLTPYYRSHAAVAVKWEPPEADALTAPAPQAGPADNYNVRVYRGRELVREVNTHQTYAILDGLPVGAAVQVRVVAVNRQGVSEPALVDVQLVNLPPAPATAPELEVNGNRINVTWEEVSGATSYELEYATAPLGRSEDNLLWRPLPTVPVPAEVKDGPTIKPHATISGSGVVYFDTRYAVRVRGRNGIGSGPRSPASYTITESTPPSPEPDPKSDEFERGTKKPKPKPPGVNPSGDDEDFETAKRRSLKLQRQTPTEVETTWLTKTGSRMESMTVSLWGKVPFYAREKDKEGNKVIRYHVWKRMKYTTTKYFYELPNWPLTLTGRIEETELFGVESLQRGLVYDGGLEVGGNDRIGIEQEKMHQEWSPQGWLNRRYVQRSKAAVMKVERDEQGRIKKYEYGNQHESVTETWQPIGDGLWFYNRNGVHTSLIPTLEDGEWEDLEPGFKATPSESSISEQAPEQAVIPKEKEEKEPPPLPRNKKSDALDRYPLDEKWFNPPAETGTPSGGGDDGDGPPGDDDEDAPAPPESPYDPPSSPGTGSGDPGGFPAPSPPPDNRRDPEPVTLKKPAPGATPGGPVVFARIPWVTTVQGLARYAAFLAQQNGPRFRITRVYLLPVSAPSLDQAVSASASGSPGQFSLTVTTESRSAP